MKLLNPTGSWKPSSEDGQALVITVFLMTVILVIAALVIDGGLSIVDKRHLQTATDAATLAAAQDLSSGLSKDMAAATACTYLNRNRYDTGPDVPCTRDDLTCPTSSKTYCVNIPPLSGPHTGDSKYIEVIAAHQAATPFLTAMTSLLVSSSARSVSAVGRGPPPPYNFVALDTRCDPKDALFIQNGGTLTVENSIYVNSCNSDGNGSCNFDSNGQALHVRGGGLLTATAIKVVGGWTLEWCPPQPPSRVSPLPVHVSTPLPDPFANKIPIPPLGSAAICPNSAYRPNQTLTLALTVAATTVKTSGTAILNGEVILIDSEQMLVTAGGGTSTLTVTRGTPANTHSLGRPITRAPGTASSPQACTVPSGSPTLLPGTYYGGICIGNPNGSACSSECNETLTLGINNSIGTVKASGTGIQIGDVIQIDAEKMLVTAGGGTQTLTVTRHVNGTVAAAHTSPATIYDLISDPSETVTLAPGTYIMAGGGLWVCGGANLSAPNVLIYNTQDPSHTTGAGAYAGITFDTVGSLTLGPQAAGGYQGLTIFQDSNNPQAITIGPGKPSNGIGGLSGTIYAPNQAALFAITVGSAANLGTANLAVFAGRITLVNNAIATFKFTASVLFGLGVQLAE